MHSFCFGGGRRVKLKRRERDREVRVERKTGVAVAMLGLWYVKYVWGCTDEL